MKEKRQQRLSWQWQSPFGLTWLLCSLLVAAGRRGVYLLPQSPLTEMFKRSGGPAPACFPAKSISFSPRAQLQTDRSFHPPQRGRPCFVAAAWQTKAWGDARGQSCPSHLWSIIWPVPLQITSADDQQGSGHAGEPQAAAAAAVCVFLGTPCSTQ